jgi:hypothetical protein
MHTAHAYPWLVAAGMGIIDDYYGGYESLALFMDEDGCVDFEAAYGEYLMVHMQST